MILVYLCSSYLLLRYVLVVWCMVCVWIKKGVNGDRYPDVVDDDEPFAFKKLKIMMTRSHATPFTYSIPFYQFSFPHKREKERLTN